VWVLPVAALFGAAGVLVLIARRTKQQQPATVAQAAADKPAPDDEYQSRLDDELDELD
jgi:cytochrome c-type biogenesis protein CcmH/NrfF